MEATLPTPAPVPEPTKIQGWIYNSTDLTLLGDSDQLVPLGIINVYQDGQVHGRK